MRWRLLSPWVVSAVSLICGCGGGSQTLGSRTDTARKDGVPALPTALHRDSEAITRLQKPEPPKASPPGNLLNSLPTRSDPLAGDLAVRIAATVNGKPIFEEEVQAAAYQFLLAARRLPEPERTRKEREILKEALDQLIERELILSDAFTRLEKAGGNHLAKLLDGANKEFDRQWIRAMKKGNNIKTDQEFKDFLTAQGLSLDLIRRQWTRNFISMEFIRSRVLATLDIKIGRQQILEYYNAHPEEFEVPDSVEWQDIFICATASRYTSREEARQFAEDLVARIKAGEDFVTLCKRYDDGDSAARNGEGNGRKRGEIKPPQVEDILFNLKDGQIGPIVEISTGFHIVRLVKRTYKGVRPFDEEVQKEIRNKLRNEMAARESRRLIAELRRKAIIQYASGVR